MLLGRCIAAFLLSLLVVAPVGAADLAVKAPPPSPAAGYDWTGFYVGGHIGYGWSKTSVADPGNWLPCCFNGGVGGTISTVDVRPSAFVGGVQAGLIYQSGWLVAGADFDWSAMNMKGSGSAASTAAAPLFMVENSGVKSKWIFTAAPTIGVARDRWLVYAKAGGAWVDNSYSDSVRGNGNASGPFTMTPAAIDKTLSGWTVGTGIKWAVADSWFVNLDYDYLDFGSKTQAFTGACPPACNFPTVVISPTFKQQISQIELGLNYKFNVGSGRLPSR